MTTTEILGDKADSFIDIIDNVTIINGGGVGLAELMKPILDGDAPGDTATIEALIDAEADTIGDEALDSYADDDEAQELWAMWSANAEFRRFVVLKVLMIVAEDLERIAEANED
jgi:hypothetical protein